jgi:hypothetical protein
MAVKKIDLEGNKLSFKITMEFGERTFEIDFAGTVDEGKLTGEQTSSQGTYKVTGTKLVRPSRRRN